jgi:hypothetical protein
MGLGVFLTRVEMEGVALGTAPTMTRRVSDNTPHIQTLLVGRMWMKKSNLPPLTVPAVASA